MKKINILQLITAILLAFIILIIIIGLYLIWFSNFYININDHSSTFKDGYQLLKHFGLSYTLSHSAKFFVSLNHYTSNYYPWIQLQIKVIIFCIIIAPILIYTVIIFIIIIFIFKIKRKNNNFWDAIQNCEIVNNYYIH